MYVYGKIAPSGTMQYYIQLENRKKNQTEKARKNRAEAKKTKSIQRKRKNK